MYQLDKQLETNRFSRFHLLCGEEVYLINLYFRALKDRLVNDGDDMNCLILEREEAEIDAIADFGMLAPFMAERRVVIVRDSGWFTAGGGAKSVENGDRLIELMGNLPETTYMIFAERNVNPKNGRVALFSGKLKDKIHKPRAGDMLLTEFHKKQGSDLTSWIAMYVARYDKKITKGAVRMLPERIGNDLYMLSAELDKLLGYIGDRPGITEDDVEQITGGVVSTKVYEMVDAVSSGDSVRALALYRNLIYNKESIDEIMGSLGRQFNTIYKLKGFEGSGIPIDTLAERVGMPPAIRWKAKSFMGLARRFEYDRLRELVEYWTDLSYQTMTIGLDKKVAAELFLIQALTNR